MAWYSRNKQQLTTTVTEPVVEERYSLADYDPAFAAILGGGYTYSNVIVTEQTALGLSALYRAVNVIAGTLATLPLKTYRTLPNGERERVASFLDSPAGPDSVTAFEWKETVALHLVLHGEAFLLHVYNNGGALIGLHPIHPQAVHVERASGLPENKLFKVSLENGSQVTLTAKDLTHVVGPSTDGLRGMGLLQVARNSLGLGQSAERAAAQLWGRGALVQGIITPADGEELTQEEAVSIKANLDSALFGQDNAGGMPIINRILKVQPWQLNAEELQFLQSRVFQVEEISRWTGVPPHLLMQTDKQSSWGTGIAEQNRALGRFVLLPWCSRLTERLSRLLPQPRFCEFDFKGLEAGTPESEINLLLAQVNGGLITLNEARRIQNLPPLDDPTADQLRIPSGVMLGAQLMAGTTPAETPNNSPAAGQEENQ